MSIWNCDRCKMPTHISILSGGLCPMCDKAINNVEQKEDVINKPKHYNFATIEPIDVIEDWQLDFRLANALKYISRAGKKDPSKTKEDLQKAVWYINRYITKECDNVKED